MIAAALTLLLSAQSADALVEGARERLKAGCERPDGSSCDAPSPDAEFRIDVDGEAAGATGKDRAVRDDGRRCAVTGPTICTRPPRRILSAPLPK
ncbi:MAG TPA: hypothetical protein VF636_02620 [Sphingomonas sp.]